LLEALKDMFEATGMLLDSVSVNNIVDKRVAFSADQIPQNNVPQPLAGELERRNERLRKLYCPDGTEKAVFILSSSAIFICQNPIKQSTTEKYLLSWRVEIVPSNTGRGYVSNCVTEFSARKSTQNLYLGVPSGDFLGNRMARADLVEERGSITPLSSMFHFPSQGKRNCVRGLPYGSCIPCNNSMFHQVGALEVTVLCVVEYSAVLQEDRLHNLLRV
jgi:hypothetical protein